MNALPPDEAELVKVHMADCAECTEEFEQLRDVALALGQVPEQAFLDGPPENAELLLRGTLRRIRGGGEGFSTPDPELPVPDQADEVTPRRTIRLPKYRELAVAAAAVVLAVIAGTVIGRSTAPAQDVAIVSPPAPPASSAAVPGTRQATSTDAKTGARLTVQVVPGTGWVRFTAAAAGIKAGQKCTLYVVSRSGERVQAGSWLVSEIGAAQGTTLQGSALVAPADVAAVEVQNSAGHVLVRTEV